MQAFYFSGTDLKLKYDDNRPIKKGITHEVEGEITPCENGLHASKRLVDALFYAPGPMLWLVELGGDVVEKEDKVAASKRTYVEGPLHIKEVLEKLIESQINLVPKLKKEFFRNSFLGISNLISYDPLWGVGAWQLLTRDLYMSNFLDKTTKEVECIFNQHITELVKEETGWEI